MRISEERFRVALKSSPTVVFNQDLELRYTWINSPVLAWAAQDYIGKTDAEIVGGEDGAGLTAIKQGVLRDGIGTRTEVAVTFQGETHYYDLTVEPLRNDQGTVVGITCSATDVTPLKRAAVELERLNELKTEVLGIVAHDLRNPISAILAITEFLADEVATVLTAEQVGLLSDIRKSSEFMVHVIDDLLDLSSNGCGVLRVDCRPADLHELLERNVGINARMAHRNMFRSLFKSKGDYPSCRLMNGRSSRC